MPKMKTVIEFDYNEFDAMCVSVLGLPRDFTVIAAMEWGNYESHDFNLAPDELEKLADYEREDMDELYAAAKEYQTALAMNGGVDPQIFTLKAVEKTILSNLVVEAHKKLWKVLMFDLTTITRCLMEQGHLQAGDHLITIFW